MRRTMCSIGSTEREINQMLYDMSKLTSTVFRFLRFLVFKFLPIFSFRLAISFLAALVSFCISQSFSTLVIQIGLFELKFMWSFSLPFDWWLCPFECELNVFIAFDGRPTLKLFVKLGVKVAVKFRLLFSVLVDAFKIWLTGSIDWDEVWIRFGWILYSSFLVAVGDLHRVLFIDDRVTVHAGLWIEDVLSVGLSVGNNEDESIALLKDEPIVVGMIDELSVWFNDELMLVMDASCDGNEDVVCIADGRMLCIIDWEFGKPPLFNELLYGNIGIGLLTICWFGIIPTTGCWNSAI